MKRLTPLLLAVLVLAACTTTPSHVDKPDGPAKPAATQTRWLTEAEVMHGLDEATQAELRFLFTMDEIHKFGGVGWEGSNRDATALARIMCTGNTDLLVRMACAENPYVCYSGVYAMRLLVPERLTELLPEFVNRTEHILTFMGDIGGQEAVGALSGEVIRQLDIRTQRELLTQTIETWLTRVLTIGAESWDVYVAAILLEQFGLHPISVLPYTDKRIAQLIPLLRYFRYPSSWDQSNWVYIENLYPMGTPEWDLIFRLALPSRCWTDSGDVKKTVEGILAGIVSSDTEDAQYARIQLAGLIERFEQSREGLLEPTVGEMLTSEALSAITNTADKRQLERVRQFVEQRFRPPNLAPSSATEALPAMVVGSVPGEVIDDWLVRFPEALDLWLDHARKATLRGNRTDVSFYRSDRKLFRCVLPALRGKSREAKLWAIGGVQWVNDPTTDDEYIGKVREEALRLTENSDPVIRWTARRQRVLNVPYGGDEERYRALSALIMPWLPEMMQEFGKDDAPFGAIQSILQEFWRWTVFDARESPDTKKWEEDPFWTAVQELYLADTAFNDPQHHPWDMTLDDMRSIEKTPQQAWTEYQKMLVDLKDKKPGELPFRPMPK